MPKTTPMNNELLAYKNYIESQLNSLELPEKPNQLYHPLRYFLQIGGKRMRPILALISSQLFSGDFQKARGAAMSVELFHNFSLIHDDIMDNAPLRRGQETVHEKWNLNVGILSGDGLLIEAYKQLEEYDGDTFKKLLVLFNKTAIEVCEGQQYDMDFETRDDVSIEEYIEMIRLKTAVLLGCSLKMGAIVGGADEDNANKIYEFGVNLGVAFQIQDDYLDSFGEGEKIGKQVGGDIIAAKKTYLLLSAYEDGNKEQIERLNDALSIENKEEKVKRVLDIFNELNIAEKTRRKMKEHHDVAISNLDNISLDQATKKPLYSLADFLFGREH